MKVKQTLSPLAICIATLALSPFSGATPAFAQNTKEAQCDRVIAVANEAVQAAESANAGEGEDQLRALLTAAASIEEAANKMENLSLSDNTLNGYRQGFIVMYRQTSLMTRRFVDAFATENQDEILAALQNLETATNDEDRLVTELNGYCGRQPS
ncbi:MAG: hypothetical protein J7647_06385 [Cyanobacteria bacterium SBLK]|nr:hypothetical protein [Cyanobacteria bacterium SBLK]